MMLWLWVPVCEAVTDSDTVLSVWGILFSAEFAIDLESLVTSLEEEGTALSEEALLLLSDIALFWAAFLFFLCFF